MAASSTTISHACVSVMAASMTRRRDLDQLPLELEGLTPPAPRVRRVRRGVDDTVKALRSTGRLEPVDAALIAMARTLSDAMDDEHVCGGSGFTVATIAGRLFPIVGELRGEKIGGYDELDALLADMAADQE